MVIWLVRSLRHFLRFSILVLINAPYKINGHKFTTRSGTTPTLPKNYLEQRLVQSCTRRKAGFRRKVTKSCNQADLFSTPASKSQNAYKRFNAARKSRSRECLFWTLGIPGHNAEIFEGIQTLQDYFQTRRKSNDRSSFPVRKPKEISSSSIVTVWSCARSASHMNEKDLIPCLNPACNDKTWWKIV